MKKEIENLIENLIEINKLNLSNFASKEEFTDALVDGWLGETIHRKMDSMDSKLDRWAAEGDNHEHISEALENGLCEGITNYHMIIRKGLEVYYNELANAAIDKIWSERIAGIEQLTTKNYKWWRADDKRISNDPELLETLDREAWERINSCKAEGYKSGELLTELNGIDYQGWWDITDN